MIEEWKTALLKEVEKRQRSIKRVACRLLILTYMYLYVSRCPFFSWTPNKVLNVLWEPLVPYENTYIHWTIYADNFPVTSKNTMKVLLLLVCVSCITGKSTTLCNTVHTCTTHITHAHTSDFCWPSLSRLTAVFHNFFRFMMHGRFLSYILRCFNVVLFGFYPPLPSAGTGQLYTGPPHRGKTDKERVSESHTQPC
jgi:hypothetical protein